MAYKKIMVNGVFANLPAQTPQPFACLIMHASGIEIYAVAAGTRCKSGANDNAICREQR
jgi:hypothetical protein